MADILIGIDLGATNVRVGAFTTAGELLHVDQTEIDASAGPEEGLERIAGVVQRVLSAVEGSRPLGLGVPWTRKDCSKPGGVCCEFAGKLARTTANSL